MAKGITTSIRLTPETRQELEHASKILHRGKNWIVNQALQSYLDKLKKKALANEAHRQSILASRSEDNSETIWQENSDTTGWAS